MRLWYLKEWIPWDLSVRFYFTFIVDYILNIFNILWESRFIEIVIYLDFKLSPYELLVYEMKYFIIITVSYINKEKEEGLKYTITIQF